MSIAGHLQPRRIVPPLRLRPRRAAYAPEMPTGPGRPHVRRVLSHLPGEREGRGQALRAGCGEGGDMTDRQFLGWLHERLQFVHGEHRNKDYMIRLRAIIRATPPEQHTPNVALEEPEALVRRNRAGSGRDLCPSCGEAE